MKDESLKIISNNQIANTIYCMKLTRPLTCKTIKPGQFINIQIEGQYLRRPISICDWDDKSISIIYRIAGKGTDWLSKQVEDKELSVLLPLGNGFDTNQDIKLIVGGGIGVPPLLGLAKEINKNGIKPKIVLGFLTKEEIILENEFKKYGEVYICTDDGTYGQKGLVTDYINTINGNDLPFATCGPLPMEKAIFNVMNAPGLISLEARMGCGFGACMGCSIETKSGNKRVCKEGPVFKSEDLVW